MKIKIVIICFLISFKTLSQEEQVLKILDGIGIKLDSTLTAGDASYMNSIYDVELFSKRFLLDTKSSKIKNFNKGFYEGFSESFKFGNVILDNLNKGGRYDYLRSFKDENGNNIIQFRLYGDDGLNYHNHIVEFVNNEPKIVDTYIFIIGEYLSETIKSMYMSLVAKQNFKSLFKSKSMNDISLLPKIKALRAEGKYEEAKKVYNQLSDKGKTNKLFMLMDVSISQNLSEEEYKKAISNYEEKFPNDPSLNLVSIDGYILTEEYDKALENINKLDKALNGDSFLDFMRGSIYYLKSDFENAEKYFSTTAEKYIDFIEPIDSLLTIYIEQQKNEKAVEVLNKMITNFQLPKDLLIESVQENFPDFSKTKEFLNWSTKK